MIQVLAVFFVLFALPLHAVSDEEQDDRFEKFSNKRFFIELATGINQPADVAEDLQPAAAWSFSLETGFNIFPVFGITATVFNHFLSVDQERLAQRVNNPSGFFNDLWYIWGAAAGPHLSLSISKSIVLSPRMQLGVGSIAAPLTSYNGENRQTHYKTSSPRMLGILGLSGKFYLTSIMYLSLSADYFCSFTPFNMKISYKDQANVTYETPVEFLYQTAAAQLAFGFYY